MNGPKVITRNPLLGLRPKNKGHEQGKYDLEPAVDLVEYSQSKVNKKLADEIEVTIAYKVLHLKQLIDEGFTCESPAWAKRLAFDAIRELNKMQGHYTATRMEPSDEGREDEDRSRVYVYVKEYEKEF